MSQLLVEGGHRLQGGLAVQGAKNASLPILAAALLGGESVIHNCPRLSDVDAAIRILESLGCRVKREGTTLTVDASDASGDTISESLMHEMRSSIVFLGAIISRMGRAKLSMPGGCELGPRPIDLHLDALKKLGVTIEDEHGFLHCTVKEKLRGAKIVLPFPSVGATENILLASVLAEGRTTIHNAAEEPEIVDLANYLNGRGAKISGAGKSTICIDGVQALSDGEHTVIPDRIVAATYLCAGAVTRGDILLTCVRPQDVECLFPVFEQMGTSLTVTKDSIRLKADHRPYAVKNIRTMPHPGFPTDAQAPVMAVLATAQGTSMFVENIFENRFKHAAELNRMGADIKVEGRVAVVNGVPKLDGAAVRAEDLRGGAALVVAGLAAEGTTTVKQICHIDRGYEAMEDALNSLGARIRRV